MPRQVTFACLKYFDGRRCAHVNFVRTPLVSYFCLMDFGKTSAGELAGLINSGEITARRVVESSLDAAEKFNEKLNAFLEINRVGALQRAEAITGQEGALAGIPI